MLQSLNLYTCVFAFLNFLVLFFVLKKVLFKPVMNYMEQRSEEIANTIKESEEAKADADQLKKEYEFQLKNAKADGQKIIDEMTERANNYYDSTIAKAEEESREILARAKEDSEREHQKILQESKAEIAGLALAAASKVIGANMDNESNRKIIDKFLEETGAA
ncbi:MAG: F0F1 ATP synthase subunit B [Clostridia bacterium]|nr:F0F1 ATP synthase subunit B [Clostridia bacterium]MBR1704380.1 F0F1 ATP synthase subunit B [Clostridia bacterium]